MACVREEREAKLLHTNVRMGIALHLKFRNAMDTTKQIFSEMHRFLFQHYIVQMPLFRHKPEEKRNNETIGF